MIVDSLVLPVGGGDLLYSFWEAGDGRIPRQPGQVRKEAAVTSFDSGRCQSPFLIVWILLNQEAADARL